MGMVDWESARQDFGTAQFTPAGTALRLSTKNANRVGHPFEDPILGFALQEATDAWFMGT